MRARASAEAAKITVFLVEDNIVMREGLRALLGGQPDITVVGYAPFGAEAMRRLRQLRPAVVILDASKTGTAGIETTRNIGRHCAFARCIVISGRLALENVLRLLDAGANGYVLAESARLKDVHEGRGRTFRQLFQGERRSPGLRVGVDKYERRYDVGPH